MLPMTLDSQNEVIRPLNLISSSRLLSLLFTLANQREETAKIKSGESHLIPRERTRMSGRVIINMNMLSKTRQVYTLFNVELEVCPIFKDEISINLVQLLLM